VYASTDPSSGITVVEADNTSSPPQPVILEIVANTDTSRHFLVPSAQVRLEGGAGTAINPGKLFADTSGVAGRREVARWKPQTTFRVTYKICTIDDWLLLENDRKEALVKQLVPIAENASVVDIELAMRTRNSKFIDADFPPTNASLYLEATNNNNNTNSNNNNNVNNKNRVPIQWKRPEEFCLSKPILFSDIHPNHVAQGRLGDCWFLASLSIIARYPELVLNLFETRKVQEYGVKKTFLIFETNNLTNTIII
jgi:hypothetical protein